MLNLFPGKCCNHVSALNPSELPNLLSSQKLSCCNAVFHFLSITRSVSCRSINTTPARRETCSLQGRVLERLGNGQCDCDSQELLLWSHWNGKSLAMSPPACLSFSRGKGVTGGLVEALLNLFSGCHCQGWWEGRSSPVPSVYRCYRSSCRRNWPCVLTGTWGVAKVWLGILQWV